MDKTLKKSKCGSGGNYTNSEPLVLNRNSEMYLLPKL